MRKEADWAAAGSAKAAQLCPVAAGVQPLLEDAVAVGAGIAAGALARLARVWAGICAVDVGLGAAAGSLLPWVGEGAFCPGVCTLQGTAKQMAGQGFDGGLGQDMCAAGSGRRVHTMQGIALRIHSSQK